MGYQRNQPNYQSNHGPIIARAPYNFVPFSDKVLLRYKQPEDIPAQDTVDPSLKSGEIHITLTAETPILVGDTAESAASRDKKFHQLPDGRYAIPGSSLKGLIRTNMQILGFGHIRTGWDIYDRRHLYRVVASGTKSVQFPLFDYYKAVVKFRTIRVGKTSIAVPEAVKAGYIENIGGEYRIIPVQKGLRLAHEKDHFWLTKHHASMLPCQYVERGEKITALSIDGRAIPGGKTGILLNPGRPIGKSLKSHYVFPACPKETESSLVVSKEDIIAYNDDLKARENSLKAYYQTAFWALPKPGEKPKPIFYVQHNGHIFMGMTRFPRVGHLHKVTDGLPAIHRELSQQPYTLDYPSSMLGFAAKEYSRCSRVSFGQLVAQNNPSPMSAQQAVLGEPKSSFYAAYTEGGRHYSEDEFHLRGTKQYWLKKKAETVATDKANVCSNLYPLPAGTKFSGTIRYANLYPDELGLLLWSLRLEPDCFQTLGSGKSYGFGRCSLTIDRLTENPGAGFYDSFDWTKKDWKQSGISVDKYIRIYQDEAKKVLGIATKVSKVTGPKEFLFMHSKLQNPKYYSYMDLWSHAKVTEPMKTVCEIIEDQKAEAEAGCVPKPVTSPSPAAGAMTMAESVAASAAAKNGGVTSDRSTPGRKNRR